MAGKRRMTDWFDLFDRLSLREKILVSSLVGGVLIAMVAITWMVVGNQIAELETRIAETRDTLDQIMARKDKYLAEKSRLKADQERLEQNEVKLVRLMEEHATAQGITIENFKANRRVLTENYRRKKGQNNGPTAVKDLVEESQAVTLRKISLDQLSKFMRALESQPEPVRVTRLSVATLNSNRQVLREVKLTVATYKKEEVAN